jgi:hypothetical protein
MVQARTWLSSRLDWPGQAWSCSLPTYRSDLTTPDGLSQTGHDIACGYWFARTDASQHGGDLSEPVTALGWSLDADFAVLGGLSVAGPSPDDPCPGDTPAPDVVVGISCCYYEDEGKPIHWFDDVSSWGNSGRRHLLARW